MNQILNKEYYLISEAAEFFPFLTKRKTGRNRTIWNWVKSGKLKAIRAGGFYQIPKVEIEKMLKHSTETVTTVKHEENIVQKTDTSDNKEYYHISEAAECFPFLTKNKINRNRTIWKWIKSGKLKAIRAGGFYQIPKVEIEKILHHPLETTTTAENEKPVEQITDTEKQSPPSGISAEEPIKIINNTNGTDQGNTTSPKNDKKIRLRAEEAHKVMLGHFLLYGRYPSTKHLGKLMGVSLQRAQVYINDLARLGMLKFSNDGYKVGYDYRSLIVKHHKEIKNVWLKENDFDKIDDKNIDE